MKEFYHCGIVVVLTTVPIILRLADLRLNELKVALAPSSSVLVASSFMFSGVANAQ